MKMFSLIKHSFLLLVILIVFSGCTKRVPATGENNPNEEALGKEAFLQYAKPGTEMGTKKKGYSSEIIDFGDQLDLIIYEKLPVSQEQRLEKKRVDENGTIFILPAGEITVAGLSIEEAQKAIEDSLSEYVVSPHCEIEISKKGYEPHIFIFGEAAKTGALPLKKDDRLMDIIAAAGGCKDDAYRRNIKVVRMYEDRVGIFSINLYDIVSRGQADQNIALRDQDIVFVPRRLYTNLKEVAQIIGPFISWVYMARNFTR